GCARRGKTSVDWFFGFKLHLVVNDCGELLALRLTPGNTDDRRPVPELVKGLFGKLFGDKGYVSQPLFETLYDVQVQMGAWVADHVAEDGEQQEDQEGDEE